MGWRCSLCGEYHDEMPLVYGPEAPEAWVAIHPLERSARGELTPDVCVLDDRHYFIRGRLEIPILGSEEHFAWLVWTSLRQADFRRAGELWNAPGREAEPPYFGWLNTDLRAVYGQSSLNLKTNVHTRPVGQRPFVEVEPTNHPLALEQRAGMTWARVQAIAEQLLHGGEGIGAGARR
jgi:hypothetical protein